MPIPDVVGDQQAKRRKVRRKPKVIGRRGQGFVRTGPPSKPVYKPAYRKTKTGNVRTKVGRKYVPSPGRVSDLTKGKVRVRTAGGEVRYVTPAQRGRLYGKARKLEKDRRAVAQLQGYPSLREYARANRASPKPADLKLAGINIDRITGKGGRAALDVLEETTRPVHAIASGYREQVKALKRGKSPFSSEVPKGFAAGLRNKRKDTFSDVLKEAGVKGPAAGIGGFGLDVVADPLTYATLGAAVPAKAAAKAAAEVAAKKAVARGATRKEIQKARSVASRKAWRETQEAPGKSGKRVKVGFAGKSVTTPIPAPRLSEGVREKLGKAFPVRPPGISEQEWTRLQAADRRRRGTQAAETKRSSRRAIATRKALGGAQRRILPERPAAGEPLRLLPRARTAPVEASKRVRDAIESGDLASLPKLERAAAKEVVRENRRLIRLRRAAGEKPAIYQPREVGEPKGYVSRVAVKAIDDPAVRRKVGRQEAWAERKVPTGPAGGRARSARRTTTEKDYQRVERRPMAQVREDTGAFVEDIPTTMLAKAQKDIGRAVNTRYRGEVKSLGRKVKQGRPPKVRDDEAVYTVKDNRLTEVTKGEEIRKLAATRPKDLVVLKRAIGDHANEQMARQGRIPFLDAATNKIKFALTIPNPQYWIRNYYGGLYNAWAEGVTARGMAKALPTAHKVARRQGKIAKAEETLGAVPKKPAGTIRIGDKKVGVDEFIGELENVSVSGGGMTSELLGAQTRRRSKMQTFEDVPRLASYIHYRRKGLNPDKAVEHSMRSQVDYGALTAGELAWARRVFPFYTWRSRNIALQARTAVQRPGKLATVQKAREELGKERPGGWESKLSEGEALGVPLAIPKGVPRVGGQNLYPALPITDLNLFTSNPSAWAQQLMGSTNPVAKSIVEFSTGYNFFFRDRIEGEGRKWYSAPDAVIDRMPDNFREKMVKDGILRKGVDRWTGEKTWQWRGRADYLAKFTPITSTLFQAATSGRSRKGQKSEQRVASWLTGLRTAPFEPEMNKLYKVYEDKQKIQSKIDDLTELRIHKDKQGKQTKEYRDLWAKLADIDKERYRLEKKLGKKDLTKPRGGGKKKGSKNPYSGGGGGSGGESNPYAIKQSDTSPANPY